MGEAGRDHASENDGMSHDAAGDLHGAARSPMIEPRDARLLVTAAEAVRVFPFAGLSAVPVNGRGGVSRDAFEDHLEGREACLLEAFEQALALAAERASAAYEAQEGWLDRVRAGLLALLEFFDEEPALARFLVVHSAQAGPAVQARRGEVLDRLAPIIDDERATARGYPPPLTAQAVVSGVLGVLQGRLSKPNPGALVKLTGPLMSFVVLPFLGVRVARSELSRPLGASSAAGRSVAVDLLEDPSGRRNRQRAMLVLRAIAEEPGLSNRELALRAGIKHEAIVSRVLAGLTRRGLIENARGARRPGVATAWRLTASARELERALAQEVPVLDPSVAFDLSADFAGRLDDRTASVLRAIGEQPWLSSRELALRVGIKDDKQISYVLRRLVTLGLAASTRDAQLRGAPNVWQLTLSGEELDRAAGRETPARKRSVALDLMQDSGGRLSDRAVSMLRLIGTEPGLSSREVAIRVGATAQNASQIFARLTERRLIENTRSSGRENVWQLTATGDELERAIWQETPAAEQRTTAVDLLRDSGGHLNDRVVSVLRPIRSEPGLIDNEIALRVAVKDPEEISHLLRRLARLWLIENTRRGSRDTGWQFTASGRELDVAVGRETPAPRRSVALDLMGDSGGRLSDRAISVLRAIGAEPGLSNREVALRVGIRDGRDGSLLLARLADRGLIENARSSGRENVWQLTAGGQELERAIWHETSAAVQRSVALDLLRDPGGRVSDRAIPVLLLIASEPGLSNSEIALREGIEDEGHASRLLARLARFALIENARSSGREHVWQLTPNGRELERAITHETPAPVARSAALDRLRDSDGRLNDRAVSVLRLIGAEPGHSNSEIALRVGIEDDSQSSLLLARLARFGLIENTKTGGLENVWQLTASGREIERAIERETPAPRAIRQEAPAPAVRSVALDLMLQSGGRLSDRAVSVLRLIAVEPGLSNSEIALRVGTSSSSHMSTLLARLARRGLIENAMDAALFEANAWQLTASGKQLETAIRRENPDAGR